MENDATTDNFDTWHRIPDPPSGWIAGFASLIGEREIHFDDFIPDDAIGVACFMIASAPIEMHDGTSWRLCDGKEFHVQNRVLRLRSQNCVSVHVSYPLAYKSYHAPSA
jgi:hypothetical protein